jgi:hypothetical protein
MEAFDRLGAGLVGWEFASLAVGIVLLPLADSGRVAGSLLLLLAANAVAMGTAVVAWVLTHLLAKGRNSRAAPQTAQERLSQRLRPRRGRHSETH